MNREITKPMQKKGIRRLERFNAQDILGSPFPVILENAVDEKYDMATGLAISHVIPDVQGLTTVVALLRAGRNQKLNGKEIKFLRKSLSSKAVDFAEAVGISPEQLSRYENDKQPIPLIYERLLRGAVYLGHFETAYRMGMDMKNLLTMKIVSAHSVENACFVSLCLEIDPNEKKKPVVAPPVPDIGAWKRVG